MLDARFAVAALVSGFLSVAAQASEPASQDVALPTQPGQTVKIEWTGTALPGVTGIGTTTGLVAEAVPCPPVGPDDAHTVNITGAADPAVQVIADFHIEWDIGAADPVGSDLVLTVYKDTIEQQGYSDGVSGTTTEDVGLLNPGPGAYTAVVCPWLAAVPTPYRASLTLKAVEPNACLISPSAVVTNAPGGADSFVHPERASLPNFDRFGFETADQAAAVPTHAAGRHQAPIYDRTLGLPTFLWARTDAAVAAVGALPPRELLIERARAHLRSEAKLLRLDAAALDAAQVFDAQFNGNGPAVVRFRQVVDGLEVYQRALNVMLARDYRPIAVSGYFAPTRTVTGSFTTTAPQAIARAWTSLGGALDAAQLTAATQRGAWTTFEAPELAGSHTFERAPRARQVLYPRAAGLEPAWHVEVIGMAKGNGQVAAYGMVVSAVDGAILQRKSLESDAVHTYRMYADPGSLTPYDSPLGNDYTPFRGLRPRTSSSTHLITLDHAGIVTGDPWLAEDATTTVGNSVDACIDSVDLPSAGFSVTAVAGITNTCREELGDVRPAPSGPATFDYDFAADEDPANANARNGAAVNLFYMNAWLHDWWYNHGFDEVAGNAQTTNYGRNGYEKEPDPVTGEKIEVGANDALIAQGQDGSGRNNANMVTPADGSPPIMQQYLFDGPAIGEVRMVAPVDSGPLKWVAISDAGAPEYEGFTGSVALVNDGLGDSMTDGCGPAIPYPDPVLEAAPTQPPAAVMAPPQPSLSGKIALIDRGTCFFTGKIQFAMASGATALIIVNNADGDPPSNVGNGDVPLSPVQPTANAYRIPTVLIRRDDGQRMKDLINGGADVQVYLQRSKSIDLDGTLDNQIIAHEFFHYVHHRLTDSSSEQTGAMSEGWGDINGFMLALRANDTLVPGNAQFQGAYGLAGYVANNFFAGIRRVPYSTDFALNAFTFRHLTEGEPTPDGGDGTLNSEVHNAGEIWANAVFECYAGLQNSPTHSFAEAQSRMQDYIVAGLKMTPANATFTEARDAVLAAVLARDADDYARCSHGFAKRGMGLNAVAPARASATFEGIVEDYSEFVCAVRPRSESLPSGEGAVLGAFNPGMLLPLLGLALLRRRRRRRSAAR